MIRYTDVMGQVWFNSDAIRVENIEDFYEDLLVKAVIEAAASGNYAISEVLEAIARDAASETEEYPSVAYLSVDYVMNMTQDDAQDYINSTNTNNDLCNDIYQFVADNMNLSVSEVEEAYHYYDNIKLERIIAEAGRYENY